MAEKHWKNEFGPNPGAPEGGKKNGPQSGPLGEKKRCGNGKKTVPKWSKTIGKMCIWTKSRGSGRGKTKSGPRFGPPGEKKGIENDVKTVQTKQKIHVVF